MSPLVSVSRFSNIAGPAGETPPDLQFASSWSTDLGTSVAARFDTGRTRAWQGAGDFNTNANVILSNGDFPSVNCLDLTGNTGAMYLRGFSPTWVITDLAENQYYTHRFLLIPRGASLEPTIDTNPGGSRGSSANQERYYPGVTMTPGNLYDLQIGFRRTTGLTYILEAIVYQLDPVTHTRTSVLAQSLEGGTNNWNFPATFTGGGDNWESVRDYNFGIAEDLGGEVHPFWPGYWSGTPSGSYNNDSMGAWHWPVTNVTENSLGRIGCFTICKGNNATREFPLRQWTQAEEDWTP